MDEKSESGLKAPGPSTPNSAQRRETPRPPSSGPFVCECGHVCETGLSGAGTTQEQIERLRQELRENLRLWVEARKAVARTLSDLAPSRLLGANANHSDEFARGWNQCVVEIEHRISELRKIL